tara:strand:+ start:1170 stop:1685 length:516 start_codon:yes stop_codon:yes gene_type:complete
MSKTILEAINQLEKEISQKEAALIELKKMIGVELSNEIKALKPSTNYYESDSKINEPFPIKGRPEQKAMFLYSHVFQNGKRMFEIQETIDKYNGDHLRIDNTIRRLKEEGILIGVKYNNQNKLTFWGLREWVNFDEGDYKEQYRPSKNELPLKVVSSEIITSKNESVSNDI